MGFAALPVPVQNHPRALYRSAFMLSGYDRLFAVLSLVTAPELVDRAVYVFRRNSIRADFMSPARRISSASIAQRRFIPYMVSRLRPHLSPFYRTPWMFQSRQNTSSPVLGACAMAIFRSGFISLSPNGYKRSVSAWSPEDSVVMGFLDCLFSSTCPVGCVFITASPATLGF